MVKASVKDEKVDIVLEGSKIDIANDTLNLIRSLMASLKTEDPLMHFAVIKIMAEEPTILTGDTEELGDMHREDLSPFVRMMSEKTDESVIG